MLKVKISSNAYCITHNIIKNCSLVNKNQNSNVSKYIDLYEQQISNCGGNSTVSQ